MKSWIIISVAALIALGPLGTQLRADDAHHPEKSATAKKSTATKPKQQKKKPAVKTDKSSHETRPSVPARNS